MTTMRDWGAEANREENRRDHFAMFAEVWKRAFMQALSGTGGEGRLSPGEITDHAVGIANEAVDSWFNTLHGNDKWLIEDLKTWQGP